MCSLQMEDGRKSGSMYGGKGRDRQLTFCVPENQVMKTSCGVDEEEAASFWGVGFPLERRVLLQSH